MNSDAKIIVFLRVRIGRMTVRKLTIFGNNSFDIFEVAITDIYNFISWQRFTSIAYDLLPFISFIKEIVIDGIEKLE